jgi:hypothetical protein
MTIEYKYNEGDLLREITQYINATYGEHYSQNQYQATEFIIDGGHGIGFTVGNILKYAQRYGHKGTPEDWRKDLLKVIHYAIIAMHVHDKDKQNIIPETTAKVNTKVYELKTSLSLSDTINIKPDYTFPKISLGTGEWNYDNMGTTSLLTSDNIPGIIEFTAENSKKTKKKKD